MPRGLAGAPPRLGFGPATGFELGARRSSRVSTWGRAVAKRDLPDREEHLAIVPVSLCHQADYMRTPVFFTSLGLDCPAKGTVDNVGERERNS